jgi:hypothetical protein
LLVSSYKILFSGSDDDDNEVRMMKMIWGWGVTMVD